jgi:hypothetical protein
MNERDYRKAARLSPPVDDSNKKRPAGGALAPVHGPGRQNHQEYAMKPMIHLRFALSIM